MSVITLSSVSGVLVSENPIQIYRAILAPTVLYWLQLFHLDILSILLGVCLLESKPFERCGSLRGLRRMIKERLLWYCFN